MKSILDKSFRYTPSAQTNLKATFQRVRKEMREQKQLSNNVTSLKRAVK